MQKFEAAYSPHSPSTDVKFHLRLLPIPKCYKHRKLIALHPCCKMSQDVVPSSLLIIRMDRADPSSDLHCTRHCEHRVETSKNSPLENHLLNPRVDRHVR